MIHFFSLPSVLLLVATVNATESPSAVEPSKNLEVPLSNSASTTAAPIEGSSSPAPSNISSSSTSLPASSPAISNFSPDQIEGVKALIKSTIAANPDLIINALQAYSEKQQAEQQEETNRLINKHKDDLLNKETSCVLGNPNGTAQLIVFADPNCPHCRELEKILLTVKGKFPELGIYVRHWAILGEDSIQITKGIVAAQLQHKFEPLSLKISNFENQLNFDGFLKLAQEAGLNVEQLKKDSESPEVDKIISATNTLATNLKLQATPTTILSTSKGLQLITPTDEESLIDSLKQATVQTVENGNLPS